MEMSLLGDAFEGGVFRARLEKFGVNIKRMTQGSERTVWASFKLDNTAAIFALGDIPEGAELGEDVHPLSDFETELKSLVQMLYKSAGEYHE